MPFLPSADVMTWRGRGFAHAKPATLAHPRMKEVPSIHVGPRVDLSGDGIAARILKVFSEPDCAMVSANTTLGLQAI